MNLWLAVAIAAIVIGLLSGLGFWVIWWQKKHTPGTFMSITHAKHLRNYVIEFVFNDGTHREVDFEPFLNDAKHPTTRSYLDESKFREFRVVDGDISWNDYELCVPISQIYSGQVSHKGE